MIYKLEFKRSALKEWKKLSHIVQQQFKKKLEQRLHNPHVPTAALSGASNLYKVKLRQLGYRLVYSVNDKTVTVIVIAVGKRNKAQVYNIAMQRLSAH